jgi:hypothetical protein
VTETDVGPKALLSDLIEVRSHPDGIDQVRRLARLRGGLDGHDSTVLGRALADWSVAGAASELDKAFALDPWGLLATGWNQAVGVRKAIKASLGPPPSSAAASLLKHDLEIKLKPRLVLSIEGVDCLDVEFELQLLLAIESAELEFKVGALAAVNLGKVTGSLTVACRGTQIPAFSRELRFRSAYHFDPPLSCPTPIFETKGPG